MIAWDLAVAPSVDGTLRRSMEDLIDRIGLDRPRRIVDLGCGTGRSSRLLAQRYPEATITAVNTNEKCLEQARNQGDFNGRITYVSTPVEEWDTFGRADIVFSSGLFQRFPGHERLFPSLLRLLPPWGVLAVVMPRATDGPHQHPAPVLRGLSWFEALDSLNDAVSMAPAIRYSRILTPRVQKLDIWETVYHAVLKSHQPVAETPRPAMEKTFMESLLDRRESSDLPDQYIEQVRNAYPTEETGVQVQPLRHIFIVARNPVTQYAD